MDNSMGKYGERPKGECNMKCSKFPSTICGGTWRNSVYTLQTGGTDDKQVSFKKATMSTTYSGAYAASKALTGGLSITKNGVGQWWNGDFGGNY